jgi:hypothetical protein
VSDDRTCSGRTIDKQLCDGQAISVPSCRYSTVIGHWSDRLGQISNTQRLHHINEKVFMDDPAMYHFARRCGCWVLVVVIRMEPSAIGIITRNHFF